MICSSDRSTRSSTRACTPRCGGFTTNGYGFGIGWYDNDNSTTPGVFKGTHPAWNDENLREVATQIRTPLLFAHVRVPPPSLERATPGVHR